MASKIDLRSGQKIVFIGDSITDAGRMLSEYRPFGSGYVNFTANYLLAKYPQMNLNIVNTGISGDTIEDLQGRWDEDCLNHKPDILSVLVGINDLWRRFEDSSRGNRAVLPDQYESVYRKLLGEAREKYKCQFVLMEPFLFCGDMENEMYKALRAYIEVVHRLADEFDAVLVPVQSHVDEQIKKVASEKWSDDMVHPFVWAHAWISQRWLEAMKL